jgi:hypothetical protein
MSEDRRPEALVPERAPHDRVSVTLHVDAPQRVAFDVFTGEIDLWWRHGRAFRSGERGHSVLHLEPGVGGRLFEQIGEPGADADPGTGAAHVVQTGTVTAWDPPHGLAIEWRGVNFAPGERTTIDVRFEPRGTGTTVTLVHRGFASLRLDHPVRHGQPAPAFIRELAMWWSSQFDSLRQRFTRRAPA